MNINAGDVLSVLKQLGLSFGAWVGADEKLARSIVKKEILLMGGQCTPNHPNAEIQMQMRVLRDSGRDDLADMYKRLWREECSKVHRNKLHENEAFQQPSLHELFK